MSDQATILIKKSDGSTERISLAEFRARKKKGAAKPPPEVKIKKEIKKIVSPAVMSPTNAGRGRPAVMSPTNAGRGRPAAGQELKKTDVPAFSKKDAASLLEEPPLAEDKNISLISRPRISQADAIIKKLSFKPSDQTRLRGLIQLRLKDVRGEDETAGWLMRASNKGGAGLDSVQAKEVLKLCREVMGIVDKTTEIKALKKRVGKSQLPSAYHKPPVPAVILSKKEFIAPPAGPREVKGLGELRKIRETSDSGAERTIMPARPIVKDIMPAKKTGTSPTDEIASMSLVDFRRLSVNPAEAKVRLKQKFINLRDESYLLYLEALAAWKNSPLYREYIGSVIQALNKKVALNSLLDDKKKIQMNEISELIKMEKEL